MDQPLIQVRDVSKQYGAGDAAVKALDQVSLDVAGGEMLMLLGPSGSGKTTLLSVMGAILQATSGSVKIAGHEIVGVSEGKLPRVRLENIGFIFQGFNLFPALTARENVEIALTLKGASKRAAKAKAEQLLEQVGLASRMHHVPADLSGGQKQRVAIARALAGDPRIVLADEPTAALDTQSGQLVMEMLGRLARQENRAVVIVTHDSRVLEYGTRHVRIADGKIVPIHSIQKDVPHE
jgi:putative ABC transport system ATP-binding protein